MSDSPGPKSSQRRALQPPGLGALSACVLPLSGSLIGLEISLLRALQIAYWHHFAYLVISTAMLGFAVSGTILTLLGERLRRHAVSWVAVAAALSGLLTITGWQAAQSLQIDIMAIWQAKQWATILLYHLLMLLPFAAGGFAVGLSLIAAGRGVSAVYAANLVGSGIGGAAALVLLDLFAPQNVIHGFGLLMAASALPMVVRRMGWVGRAICLGTIASTAAAAILEPASIRVSSYKALARMEQLEQAGLARKMATRHTIRGRIDLFDTPTQHTTLFVDLAAEPPPAQWTLLLDGSSPLPVLLIRSADEAPILSHTLMDVVYRLVKPRSVALLEEVSGLNVWLAKSRGVERIVVVTPHRRAAGLLAEQLPAGAASPFALAGVEPAFRFSRAWLDRTSEKFDLIQIVSAEAMPAGSHGLAAGSSDYLLTVEALTRCVELLSPGGAVAVIRGMQMPPRDNFKILATIAEALRRAGRDPARCIVQIRNYLAVCTIGLAQPASADLLASLERICRQRGIDLAWHWDLRPEQTNHFDVLPPLEQLAGSARATRDEHMPQSTRPAAGAAARPADPFYVAAKAILRGGGDSFLRAWPFDVRPATDDRPFFHNFFKWQSLGFLRRAYGTSWLARSEWGYLAVWAALVEAVALALLLVVAPTVPVLLRSVGPRMWVSIYFGLLGAAFMWLEMAAIALVARATGEPVVAVGAVLSGFLVAGGLGSLSLGASKSPAASARRLRFLAGQIRPGAACAIVAVVGALTLGIWPVLRSLTAAVDWPVAALLSGLWLVPVAFCMGKPFASGMRTLAGGWAGLQGWAWAINGALSVLATSAAVLMAMSYGWRWVWLVGCGAYVAAALAGRKLAQAE